MEYVLLGLCIAFLAVIAILALVLRSSLNSERAAMAAEQIAGRQQLLSDRGAAEAERQRDAAIIKAATAQAAADRAIEQLATTQAALNAATARLVERVKAEVHGASAEQVSAIVADLLAAPILPTSKETP